MTRNEVTISGLVGKTVVVTGAAGGQGIAETQLLLACGATVIATDTPDTLPDALAQAVKSHPSGFHYRQLDVSSESDWQQVASFASSLGRGVQGLVNNAGIPFRGRIGEIKLDDWNRVFAVNTTGPMLGIQAMVPLMSAGSSIVNVGSAAALNAHYTVAYTASKWALRGLTHATATEFGPLGIRTNIVHPGFIETPMMAAAPEIMRDAQIALTPLERTGVSDEVAAVVAFLISDLSSYVNGAEIPIDGGFTSSAGVKYMSDVIKQSQAKSN
jgi:3alpha(or 20beta)-hydroxysteroid dehydrogenase